MSNDVRTASRFSHPGWDLAILVTASIGHVLSARVHSALVALLVGVCGMAGLVLRLHRADALNQALRARDIRAWGAGSKFNRIFCFLVLFQTASALVAIRYLATR